VAVLPDHSIVVPLSTAQKDTLALAGFLVVQPGQIGMPEIRDDLTTAPWTVNNALNPFSQWNVRPSTMRSPKP
jgi:hypothetical protein